MKDKLENTVNSIGSTKFRELSDREMEQVDGGKGSCKIEVSTGSGGTSGKVECKIEW